MQRRVTEKILLVASAALLFASIFGWFGSTLPEYYESKTSLIVKPPQISGKVIASLTEEELEQKLATMNQEILSDSTLEPMIFKYQLFEVERAERIPMKLIIERMRKNIRVEPEKSNEGRLAGFSLTYRDISPEKARNVAAELAGKYENLGVWCCQCENIDDFIGETIRIVEPANLPKSPISPTWLDFTLIGAGFGFFVGFIVLGLSLLANILRIRFAELDLQ